VSDANDPELAEVSVGQTVLLLQFVPVAEGHKGLGVPRLLRRYL